MARINTNVASLIAQTNLKKSNDDLQVRLQRLSTGLRINKGADDPAGLIISERIRAEVSGVNQAINNAERASNVLATSEGALSEVSSLLTSIKALTVEAANNSALSKEEIEANQLQVDSAVDSITRIANTTSFAGLKLLNGSLDYITSGVATSAISDVNIFSANFGTNSSLPISTQVLASAQKAGLFLSTGSVTIPSAVTLEIAGYKGTDVIQLASGSRLSAIAFAINRSSDSTGVTARVVSGAAAGLSALVFESSDFGTSQFVSVNKVPGTGGSFLQTFDKIGAGAVSTVRDTGADVLALVNGTLAIGDGTKVRVNTAALKLELQLTDAFAQKTGAAGTKTFAVTGGGATFQLGPSVETSQQISFGIQSVNASRLGNSVVGFLNSIVSGGANSLVAGKTADAGAIIEAAITQVAVFRGRLGSFEKNTLNTNVNSLQTSLENLSSAESRIRDADFAEETSKLTRAQVLTSVGTSVLAQANSTSQNVLALLRGG
ncbi:MAG: flagellin [Planctomycetes bacterium]|nr:flagellin [Planctomycetota bacterium]